MSLDAELREKLLTKKLGKVLLKRGLRTLEEFALVSRQLFFELCPVTYGHGKLGAG